MAENAEYTKTQITRNPVYLKSLNRSKRAEKFKKFIGNKTEGNYLVNNAFIVVVVAFWPFLCWEFTHTVRKLWLIIFIVITIFNLVLYTFMLSKITERWILQMSAGQLAPKTAALYQNQNLCDGSIDIHKLGPVIWRVCKPEIENLPHSYTFIYLALEKMDPSLIDCPKCWPLHILPFNFIPIYCW